MDSNHFSRCDNNNNNNNNNAEDELKQSFPNDDDHTNEETYYENIEEKKTVELDTQTKNTWETVQKFHMYKWKAINSRKVINSSGIQLTNKDRETKSILIRSRSS